MPTLGKNPQKENPYWSKPLEDLYLDLDTSPNGLTQKEAERRTKTYGPNELTKKEKHQALRLFVDRFKSPLVLILLFASLISFSLQERIDGAIIITIVLVSTVIDFMQHWQSGQAVEKLKNTVKIKTIAEREGEEIEIPVSELVPGDVISLSAGNIVPADCRIISSNYLVVSESALTGESFPIEKKEGLIDKKNPTLPEKTNCLFFGTSIAGGSARCLVVKTGKESELGKISSSLSRERPPTEFDKGLRNFSLLILRTTIVLAVFIFLFHFVARHDVLGSLLFAVALAVGLTPEMLPMFLAVNLKRGVLRMSKHGVIVKDLMAIQNFGSMDILCADKTGTLTEDQIKLERYENIKEEEDQRILLLIYLNSFFQTGIKNPLDRAVLAHKGVNEENYKKLGEVPFDFNRKRLSVIVEKEDNTLLLTKGATESVINICRFYEESGTVKPLNEEVQNKIQKRFESLSKEGYRVLAVATKPIIKKGGYSQKDEEGLIFQGLTAFLDPPKESAKEGLEALKKKGIALKILTGDNRFVTKKICDFLGLSVSENQVLDSQEIDNLDDNRLAEKAEEVVIFAKLTPDQKNRIIKVLRDNGHVVGFLGDGVNDAPSLHTADIGISVDNATDVAKEAADIILLKKSLRVLTEGVHEGRQTFANILKYIHMDVSSSFGNMLSLAAASLFLPFMPALPKQVLLNDLLYDASQLALPSDNVDEEYLSKPRKWSVSNLKSFMLVFGPLSSIFDLLTFFIMLFFFRASVPLFQTAWFTESLVTQTLIILSIRTKRVPFFKSKIKRIFVSNLLFIILVAVVLPFLPVLSPALSFARPPLTFYPILLVILLSYFVVIELAKKWYYKTHDI